MDIYAVEKTLSGIACNADKCDQTITGSLGIVSIWRAREMLRGRAAIDGWNIYDEGEYCPRHPKKCMFPVYDPQWQNRRREILLTQGYADALRAELGRSPGITVSYSKKEFTINGQAFLLRWYPMWYAWISEGYPPGGSGLVVGHVPPRRMREILTTMRRRIPA